jgi:Na+/phosphate symporter
MIADMVKAHLENVKSLINDLEKQKLSIMNEIDRLRDYLEKGNNELTLYEKSLAQGISIDSFSKKQFLGE